MRKPICVLLPMLAAVSACSPHPDEAKRYSANVAPVGSVNSSTAAVRATDGGAAGALEALRQASVAPDGAPQGTDFAAEARLLAVVAACAPGSVPAGFDQAVVISHCGTVRAAYTRYEQRWLSQATPFFRVLRPKDLPGRVVYPFGGGDLVTALAVFPDATELTTISLEPPGDVRLVRSVAKGRLRAALRTIGQNVRKLLGFSYSNTLNLDVGARSALPGEIVLHLAGLEVHGFEVLSLRYFEITEDGSLRYLEDGELNTPRAPRGGSARTPFDNVEIRFAPRGAPASARTLRHIAQDLSNPALGLTPGLSRYLEARGRVAAMTKAASHLLWSDEFSVIRRYLLDHVEWMVSDSTGIPPRFATAAGFVQEPFGVFEGPSVYGPVQRLDSRGFRQLFADNPRRPLGFRFGYGDVGRRAHLIVTRRPPGPSR